MYRLKTSLPTLVLCLLTLSISFHLIFLAKLREHKANQQAHIKAAYKKQLKENIALKNKGIILRHQHVDKDYLYSKLESITDFSGAPIMSLVEKKANRQPQYNEKEISTKNKTSLSPVELRAVLDAVEGLHEEAPQLFFKKFSLVKKSPSENHLYELNFELLKREYL